MTSFDETGKEYKKLYKFNIGRIAIIPDKEWDTLHSYEEMEQQLLNIKQYFDAKSKFKLVIYEKNTYCNEVNGGWNIVMSVTLENKHTYMYMYRRDIEIKKMYACPLDPPIDYTQGLKHITWTPKNEDCKSSYDLLQDAMEHFLGKSTKIDHFPGPYVN